MAVCSKDNKNKIQKAKIPTKERISLLISWKLKRIIKNLYEQLYAHNFDILNEMEKILKTQNYQYSQMRNR